MPLGRPGGARHPAPRRHHPRLLAHQPVQGRGRRGADQGEPGRARRGRADRDRRRGHPRRGDQARTSYGVHVVGVPKTIDNDLNATDYTFGFDTAVNIATEAIDRLHTTAESHIAGPDRRGHGPARRLDRAALGHGRRRERHPHPRGHASTSTRSCAWVEQPLRARLRPDRGRRRGRDAQGRPDGGGLRRAGRLRPRPPRRHRRAAGRGDRAAHEEGGPHHGPRAHRSAAAPRRRSTAGSPRASACTRSTRCTTGTSGRWSRCAGRTSSGCR